MTARPSFRGSLIAAGAAAAGLAGCMVGPNFHRPAPPTPTGYTPAPLPSATAAAPVVGGTSQSFAQGADIAGQWWTLFGSPQIDDLVQRALKTNPDLDAARAALKAAHEAWLVQRGTLLPTADASYDVTREKASGALSPPLSTPNDLFTLHTVTLDVAYTPDVFGGLRRQIENVKAQEENQRFQSEAVFLTLTSNVVAGAIQEASLREQVGADQRIVAIATDVLKILRTQKRLGQVTGVDVATQEAALAQAEQALPPLEKQLAAQRDQLADLTGRTPSEDQDPPVRLASLALPGLLPVTLPSKLVDQRPDIRAAEASLHAASAEIGVAIANRLPNITLGGQAGGASTALSSLFASPNTFWLASGTVAQPIFEGGQLLHKQRQAQALYEEARAQYRSAVLSAFQNVADSLQAIEADSRALAAAARAETAAETALNITRKQLALGQVAGLNVLLAEELYQQALLARVQAQGARFADTVALFQSLGGGWWNRKDL
jgi:NodT family efflux transporter outer membrane factor (OMF) lipoprotein